eukprot:NODE_7059_length_420_cov_82.762803_g5434_i0.p2 GENE.NODE_7059_length_420_cov_82.762803_g5434_i0~~NODE_7059_length_420_cov_82.762803_g5434_i0.p2  ORF type:complete len:56 (+),score=26.72 NODE_7059_length_420_cov_82.762803_g5434_i0:32-169(+)
MKLRNMQKNDDTFGSEHFTSFSALQEAGKAGHQATKRFEKAQKIL